MEGKTIPELQAELVKEQLALDEMNPYTASKKTGVSNQTIYNLGKKELMFRTFIQICNGLNISHQRQLKYYGKCISLENN